MFRFWAKKIRDNHLLDDITIERPEQDSRTHKVFKALEDACIYFDLEQPIWLDSNISEFQRIAKTRFTNDSFIEDISFDYLEIQIIEEDDDFY